MKKKSSISTIKILVPTPVAPPQKDLLATFISNTLPHLQKRFDSRIVWLIHQPKKIQTMADNIYDIHNFSDAKNLLETIKPSCIITNQTYEPINYSISLAAKLLKIPLISIYSFDYQFTNRSLDTKDYLNYFISLVRRFFSSKVPTESENEKTFMKRGRFMLYKYNFLIKTKRSVGLNFLEMVQNMFKDLIMFASYTWPEYNKLADLNLLSNESWYNPLIKLGISKEKLRITGNPFWDDKFHKIKERSSINHVKSNEIRVLVLTDARVEHGLWTYDERDKFLLQLFTELKKVDEISFALKIHPASENKVYYETFLSKLNIHVPIFQLEDLWDVINGFDIVLSYGGSYSHAELSSGLVKLIILDPRNEFVRNPLVTEGTQCGHIVICNKFEELKNKIHTLMSTEIHLTEEFVAKRQKLFFQFEGKSGELVANEIFKLIQQE